MNMKEILRYAQNNDIFFDFDNNPRFIDYIDKLPVHNEADIAKIVKDLQKVCEEQGTKVTVIDSLASMDRK